MSVFVAVTINRRCRVLVGLLLAVLLTGCGDPIEQPGATRWTPPTAAPSGPQWTGKIAVDKETGAMTAPGFNALIDTETPGWAQAPDTVVAELLNLNRGLTARSTSTCSRRTRTAPIRSSP